MSTDEVVLTLTGYEAMLLTEGCSWLSQYWGGAQGGGDVDTAQRSTDYLAIAERLHTSLAEG